MGLSLRAATTCGLLFLMGMTLSASGPQAPPPAGAGQPPTSQAKPPAAPQPPATGQQPAQVQPPIFRAGVNVVRVDVIVTDKQGDVVTNLTKDDFEVQEDGKPQTVDLFKLVNSDGNPAPGAEPARPIRSLHDQEAEAARDDVRLFVIFLDDYHVRLSNSMRVREPLVKFLQTQLGPLDMVAIMYPLMSVRDLTFTRDPQTLLSAVRRFEGRKYNYSPRNPVEAQYAFYPAQTVEMVRNQVTLTALKGLAVRLGSLREGRKAVILVSEGFSSLLPPSLRDPIAGMGGAPPGTNNQLAEDRTRFLSDVDLQSDLRDVWDQANRHNTAFYALDPRGLATGEFDINEGVTSRLDGDILRSTQDTLMELANNTDGRAIINRNDLEKGLRQVVRDTSAYYLIGYNSTLSTPDGKFHKIEVKLKRPGLQLRSRKGYWAPTAEEAAKASAPPKPTPPAAVERALGAVEATPRDRVVGMWFGTARGENGRTRVTFVWEPLPPVPGEKRPEPARVTLLAATNAGQTFYRGPVPPDAVPAGEGATPPPDSAAALPTTGLRAASQVSFDANPGRIQVRVSVQNDKDQVIDTVQQELTVPDLTLPKVALSTPLVLRARTAREFQAITRQADPVPTPLREFRRTDRLLIRFVPYGPGGTVPAVTVRLLNRVGQKMSDVPVAPPADGTTSYQIDLPLAGLSPGQYLIEIKAAGESGDATELIAFRVIS